MSRKVLIIEDRRENIVFIANNILRPEGWDVITARDGKLGLQKAIEEQPDLIITDLKLPTMHGLDVLEELNKRGYRIPTIVMTFHGSEETAIRAFRLGAVDYLIKPFEIEDMMSAIDRALKVGADAQPTAAGVEKSVAEKLARQENEIQRLRAQLQQQEKVLQEHYQPGQGQPGATDVARWQALLKERDATLATIKKQTIAQHQAMTQQINHLQSQLAEKEATLASLKGQSAEFEQAPDGQRDGGDLSALRAEKARADKLVENLTRIIGAQQKAIEKHREEAERLARELHALAAGIQMLGQSLSDHAGEVSSALASEE
jgi:DNA-binding response OmpR family regulator